MLNLSCCLLPSLEAASEIVGTLPALRVLSLKFVFRTSFCQGTFADAVGL